MSEKINVPERKSSRDVPTLSLNIPLILAILR
jgi:hypothetical protein